MKHFFLILVIVLSIFACKNKSEKSSTPIVTIENEFTKQFANIELPITVADTTIDRNKQSEKPLKIYGKKYFPDSLFATYFERSEKLNYYSIGKAQNLDQEIYVIMKATNGTKKAAYLLCYDNQLNYKDGALLCKTDELTRTSFMATLKKDFNITIRKTEYIQGEEPKLTESFMVFNNIGVLGEMVTNDSDEEMDLNNPIDTLQQTKKYTGDYYYDKKNFVSLRDSKDSGKLIFFYHFEKNKQDCNGEIKDVIYMTGSSTAVFMKDGDPCKINITFSGNNLSIVEESGCGNKRPLDCDLNGTFTKKTKKVDNSKKDKSKPLPITEVTDGTKKPVNTTKKPAVKKPTAKPAPKPTTTTKPAVKQVEVQ